MNIVLNFSRESTPPQYGIHDKLEKIFAGVQSREQKIHQVYLQNLRKMLYCKNNSYYKALNLFIKLSITLKIHS